MSETRSRGAIAVKLSRIFNRSLVQQPALQLIYDTAPIGLAVLSPDCRYLQLNQRLTEICGISVEDHLGRSVRDCVPALADAVEGIVRSIMNTGEPVSGIEVASQRADKIEDRSWVTYWHPLRDPTGEIIGVNVAAEEITERKRAEAVLAVNDKALRESELRFRELADNISQFAWTADASGWIYWYNKRWHDYTGTTLEDMEGWDWQKVHHPEHVDRVVERIRRSFETGAPWEDTFPLRGKDGTYRWFLSRALPIRNEAGDVVRWFGTNTDVTEQIEAENALQVSVERQTATADILKVIASSPGPLTPMVRSTGTTSVGTTTQERSSKTCRGGAGRRFTIPSMWIVSSSAFDKASKPAPHGRTRFLSGARMAAIGGFCRVPCRFATRLAMSSVGSVPTPTLRNRSRPRMRCGQASSGRRRRRIS